MGSGTQRACALGPVQGLKALAGVQGDGVPLALMDDAAAAEVGDDFVGERFGGVADSG